MSAGCSDRGLWQVTINFFPEEGEVEEDAVVPMVSIFTAPPLFFSFSPRRLR